MPIELKPWQRVLLTIWNLIVIFCSFLLLTELSLEILQQVNPGLYTLSSRIEVWVCLIFLLDFLVTILVSEQRWKFVRYRWIFLLISVPYREIFMYYGLPMSEMLLYGFRILLLIRSVKGVGRFIALLTSNSVNQILISYSFYLVLIIYFSSISFYNFEIGINPGIKTYADALWWAFMVLTTEGSSIQPYTVEGRILTVVLITSGLGLFTLLVAGFASSFAKMRVHPTVRPLTDIALVELPPKAAKKAEGTKPIMGETKNPPPAGAQTGDNDTSQDDTQGDG